MSTNPELQKTIKELKKYSCTEGVPIWRRVALDLEKPTRARRVVNLSRINRNTKDNETIIVPGKVLASGVLDHKVNVIAFSFSDAARKSIVDKKGSAEELAEFIKKNPKAKDVRIIG